MSFTGSALLLLGFRNPWKIFPLLLLLPFADTPLSVGIFEPDDCEEELLDTELALLTGPTLLHSIIKQ